MFVESNPVPAKYSLMLLGLMTDDVRLPLVKGTEGSKQQIKQVLADLSII
jgi:4-hydroxy-tetrahydrodipicolinate synthase